MATALHARRSFLQRSIIALLIIGVAPVVSIREPSLGADPAAAATAKKAKGAVLGGKQWTQIIGVGGILIYEGLQYIRDSKHAHGARNAADGQYRKAQLFDDGVEPSSQIALPDQREKLLESVRIAIAARAFPSQMRSQYEDLRACWNATLVDPGSSTSQPEKAAAGTKDSSSTDNPAAPGSNKALLASASGPQPAPPPSCSTLITDMTDPYPLPKAQPLMPPPSLVPSIFLEDIDNIDLANAVKSPSLFQQILNERIGPYNNDNDIRARFLVAASANLIAEIAAAEATPTPTHTLVQLASPSASPAAASDISTTVKNCYTAFSVADCLSNIGAVESGIVRAQTSKLACDWAKGAVMPQYSVLAALVRPYTLSKADRVNPNEVARNSTGWIVKKQNVLDDSKLEKLRTSDKDLKAPDYGVSSGC